jgi:translation initiation factor IF-3
MAFTPHGNGGYRPKPSPAPNQQNNKGQQRPAATNNNNKDQHRINEAIRGVKEVRLVGDNVEMGIYTIQEAMSIAEEQELDLVEISPTAVPPVCKVMDYQKFCYQQKKKAKEAKANSAKMVVKEIRFGPQTDDHDYEFKLRHAKEFLQEGSKVKAYVFFKGRQIVFKDQGLTLLARFANDLENYGKPDSFPPVLEGKRMILMMSPKSGSSKKAEKPAE